jgi:hypothetical protein
MSRTGRFTLPRKSAFEKAFIAISCGGKASENVSSIWEKSRGVPPSRRADVTT